MTTTPLAEPRLRIAIVITELSRGGAEKVGTKLALGLSRRGHQVTAISLKQRPEAPRDSLVLELEQAGIELHFLDQKRGWKALGAVVPIRRLAIAERFDIVQTLLHHAGILGTIGARLAGITNIVQGIRVSDPRSSVQRIDRLMSIAAKRVVCVSESVRQLAEQTGIPSRKLQTILNGVDFPEAIPALDRTSLPLPVDAPFLLSIGRLEPQKGFAQFLPHLQGVFAQHSNLHWLVAGVGPDQAALAAQAAELGIGARVHFLGFRADTFSLIAASEMLVLPSIYEGMPNVVLETIAAGKALVATQTDGIGEIFTGHPYGSEQVAKSHAEMVPKITKLLSDEPLRNAIGTANQLHARERFTWERMVDEYEQIYREITAPKR